MKTGSHAHIEKMINNTGARGLLFRMVKMRIAGFSRFLLDLRLFLKYTTDTIKDDVALLKVLPKNTLTDEQISDTMREGELTEIQEAENGKKRYKNPHGEAIRSAVSGLFKLGAINAEEMRDYDEACLAKPAAPIQYAVAQKVAVMYAHDNNSMR
jgi:hypothetical protein